MGMWQQISPTEYACQDADEGWRLASEESLRRAWRLAPRAGLRPSLADHLAAVDLALREVAPEATGEALDPAQRLVLTVGDREVAAASASPLDAEPFVRQLREAIALWADPASVPARPPRLSELMYLIRWGCEFFLRSKPWLFDLALTEATTFSLRLDASAGAIDGLRARPGALDPPSYGQEPADDRPFEALLAELAARPDAHDAIRRLLDTPPEQLVSRWQRQRFELDEFASFAFQADHAEVTRLALLALAAYPRRRFRPRHAFGALSTLAMVQGVADPALRARVADTVLGTLARPDGAFTFDDWSPLLVRLASDPSGAVRAVAARRVPPEHREQVAASFERDPDALVQASWSEREFDLEMLSMHPRRSVRAAVARSPLTPSRVQLDLLRDEGAPELARLIASSPALSPDVADALASHPDVAARRRAASRWPASRPRPVSALSSGFSPDEDRALRLSALRRLASDASPSVRQQVAMNPHVKRWGEAVLRALADDPANEVQRAARQTLGLRERQG